MASPRFEIIPRREERVRAFERATTIMQAIRYAPGPATVAAIFHETEAERAKLSHVLNRAIEAERIARMEAMYA